ncbi:MAG: hypothetical protein P8X90_27980 [Desulfobacterales bacterium]|jgi:hypothetical protein
MIPLRDTVRAGSYPVVNNILIGINVVVFLFQLSQGADGDLFISGSYFNLSALPAAMVR